MGDVSTYTIEAAEAQDEAVLWLMLTYAASMGDGGAEQIPAAQADPYLSTYVTGWRSRAGDLGVVARSPDGAAGGAAWLRLGGAGGAFKLGDAKVPELATAVVPSARDLGLGTRMMVRLIAASRPLFPRILLSVREQNPAVRFYQRLGFRELSRMSNRIGGSSLVMALDL